MIYLVALRLGGMVYVGCVFEVVVWCVVLVVVFGSWEVPPVGLDSCRCEVVCTVVGRTRCREGTNACCRVGFLMVVPSKLRP